MKRKLMLLVTMLCLAFVGANAQNGGGNGNGQPPHEPIKIKVKGGSNPDPQGLINGITIPVSASYTSDSLFIDVTDYSGDIVVEIVSTTTNQTVSQTSDVIMGGSGSVEIDISALSHGTYRIDIYLANGEGYEGYFEME